MLGRPSEVDWFVIVSSWEAGADDAAVQRFHDVYQYLNVLAPDYREKALAGLDKNDPRRDIVPETLRALNLIGRRKFMIICQTRSNRVLQELSKKISLGAPVNVEIFPATNVHDLEALLPNEKR